MWVWRDTFICVTWLLGSVTCSIHVYDWTSSHEWNMWRVTCFIHVYERVTSTHDWSSWHVPFMWRGSIVHMNGTCHTPEESRHTYECITSHSHMNTCDVAQSCVDVTYSRAGDMTHPYMFDVTHSLCVICLIDTCDMTQWCVRDVNQSYLWRDWFIRMTWCILGCVWRDSVVCGRDVFECEWLDSSIHVGRDSSIMCDITHWYVTWCTLVSVTWLNRKFDVTYSFGWLDAFSDVWHGWFMYVWHVAFTCVTLRIHVCDVAHSHVWHY